MTAGLLARGDRRYAFAAAALFALLGGAAALSRPAGTPADALPSLVGGAVAGGTLLMLLRDRPYRTSGCREFLGTAAAVALAGAGAVVLRRLAGAAADRARETVVLPAPADPALPLTAVRPGFRTPTADFYRVDTALTVPRLRAADWRLSVGGMVDNPFTLCGWTTRPGPRPR